MLEDAWENRKNVLLSHTVVLAEYGNDIMLFSGMIAITSKRISVRWRMQMKDVFLMDGKDLDMLVWD